MTSASVILNRRDLHLKKRWPADQEAALGFSGLLLRQPHFPLHGTVPAGGQARSVLGTSTARRGRQFAHPFQGLGLGTPDVVTILCVGTILPIVGGLAVSTLGLCLSDTNCNNEKHLQTWPDVPG